ncbi:SRPBCC family protein [Blastococcus sp. TF02A_35]|uniref:SRPBCC family protein n=1 Tax=Blastococcus sp. TF02A-35 TaxID=2559612 RepID=UPI00107459BD|nr:SRPBCC family protein [Blastococcus sp. TF02A_35]TFV52034.1 SRPBCC family protein [Blastococcus sp. TF02A_35]
MTEDLETRRGVVTDEPDGRRRLEFRRSWPDPIEDVWSALTEPDRLVRWIGTFDGERRVGATGTFTMTHEAEPVGEPMTIEVCEPPHRLVVLWPQADGEPWRVDLELREAGDRTVLRFLQHFPPGTDVTDYAGGWHWYLDKFDSVVGGRAAPADWDAFWAEVGPGYRA